MRIEGKKLKKVSNKINILESIDISIIIIEMLMILICTESY